MNEFISYYEKGFVCFFEIWDSKFEIQYLKFEIQYLKFEIRDSISEIRNSISKTTNQEKVFKLRMLCANEMSFSIIFWISNDPSGLSKYQKDHSKFNI
jgi:hypothetical protein